MSYPLFVCMHAIKIKSKIQKETLVVSFYMMIPDKQLKGVQKEPIAHNLNHLNYFKSCLEFLMGHVKTFL